MNRQIYDNYVIQVVKLNPKKYFIFLIPFTEEATAKRLKEVAWDFIYVRNF